MNFNINNISFGARFTVWGKQTPAETAQVYDNAARKHADKGSIAVQAQEYFATPSVQKCISELPKDTFVRLHTGVLDGEKKREDKVLGFVPYVSLETKTINEQIALSKALDKGDVLKLSLDESGHLDKNKINEWFSKIKKYYAFFRVSE